VERNLQIIGDAAHKLSAKLKQANAEIPWDDIYAARNVVVHQYFGVNQKILWDIVQEDLDPLLKKSKSCSLRARQTASPVCFLHTTEKNGNWKAGSYPAVQNILALPQRPRRVNES
jgi:hypothetical protein